MVLKEFIKQFRQYSNDTEAPYTFSEKEIKHTLSEALQYYSKKKPILKEGCIDVMPEQKIYSLPMEYQTWYIGLENVDIVGNHVVIESPGYNRISFLYYANRRICEVSEADLQLFFDYCFGALLEKEAVKAVKQSNEAGSLKAMKLGRGLDLTFDESKNVREELLLLAKEKKQKFFDSIKCSQKGSWI